MLPWSSTPRCTLARTETPDLEGSREPPPPSAPLGASRGLAAFLEELQRRRVLRALVLYGTLAFATLQVVEPVMHGLHLPDWVLSAVVVALGLGFPLTTGLAWAFDLKATGVERTPLAAAGGLPGQPRGVKLAMILLVLGLLVAAPGIAYHFTWGTAAKRAPEAGAGENPLAGARYLRLTDFDGVEQAAALSSDGRFVAFQSDRDGVMDVWVTQVGTGQFFNLTRGGAPELVNPSIRTLGFSLDGALVTFWVRRKDGAGRSDISIWAVPLLGGAPRPYLESVAEFDWSSDGLELAYHTAGPGDPLYVSGGAPPAEARQNLTWPPTAFTPTTRSGLRTRPSSTSSKVPCRIAWTSGASGPPVAAPSGSPTTTRTSVTRSSSTPGPSCTSPPIAGGFGPWIYAIDLARPVPVRVSVGIERDHLARRERRREASGGDRVEPQAHALERPL